MSKANFKKAILERYGELRTDELEKEFHKFFLLNEASELILTPSEIKKRDEMREDMERDDQKREVYYLYHLGRLISSKWDMVTPDTITHQLYKNSAEVLKIFNKTK